MVTMFETAKDHGNSGFDKSFRRTAAALIIRISRCSPVSDCGNFRNTINDILSVQGFHMEYEK
jgi:hypothetical protein